MAILIPSAPLFSINDWLHYIDYHWRFVTVEIRNSV